MYIGQVLRTVTVEPLEEPISGHGRPAPVEEVPARPEAIETVQADPYGDPVTARLGRDRREAAA